MAREKMPRGAGRREPGMGRWTAALLLVLLYTLAALIHVHVRLQRVTLGYRLSELAERNRELADQNRKLRLEFATLSHPRRLRQWAERLGLRPPSAAQVIEPARGGKVALNSPVARER